MEAGNEGEGGVQDNYQVSGLGGRMNSSFIHYRRKSGGRVDLGVK